MVLRIQNLERKKNPDFMNGSKVTTILTMVFKKHLKLKI